MGYREELLAIAVKEGDPRLEMARESFKRMKNAILEKLGDDEKRIIAQAIEPIGGKGE